MPEDLRTIANELTEEHIFAWIEQQIELFHQQARLLVDDYWLRLAQGQKQHSKEERCHIGVRIRRREDCQSFSIEWFKIKKIHKDMQKKVVAIHIRKGRGYRYPLDRMLNSEPEWAADLITKLEVQFAVIRKKIDLLGKIRDGVRGYAKLGDIEN